MASFTQRMWEETRPVYEAILTLPFNRELAAGTLSRDRFTYYMIQDAHYLAAFSRALATASARAPDADLQVALARSAQDAILVERSLHEGFLQDFGVTAAEFAKSGPSPVCRAYADFLLARTYQHAFPVGLAALLPCFQIYYEVGKHLYGVAVRSNPYQKWIETYRDEAFGDSVRAMLGFVDAAFEDASPGERELMHDTHLTASRYEWMFWNAAYRMERWPV